MRRGRKSARWCRCASNLRSLGQALTNYAVDNHGFYPPNSTTVQRYWNLYLGMPGGPPANVTAPGLWYDQARLGKYMPPNKEVDPKTITDTTSYRGSVMICPTMRALQPTAARNYSMNMWASCIMTDSLTNAYTKGLASEWGIDGGPGTNGRLFKANCKEGFKTMLLTEAVVPTGGNFSNATIGNATLLPGGAWGSTLSATPPTAVTTGFGLTQTTNVAFFTHKSSKQPTDPNVPYGRVNICYVDGHVAMKAHTDVAVFAAGQARSGKSTMDTLWSPKDYALEP